MSETKKIRLNEISTMFDNKFKYFLHDNTNCLICEDSLEVIEVLNKYELLLYCNNCKTYHTINIKDRVVVANTNCNFKEEINKINNHIKTSELFIVFFLLSSIGLGLWGLITLFRGRWLECLILFGIGILNFIFFYFSIFNYKPKENKINEILKNTQNNTLVKDLVIYKINFNFIDKEGDFL